MIEYTNDYAKTWRSLWQYCRDEPEDDITDSRFKVKTKGRTPGVNSKDVETAAPLKYLSHFWRTLEMSLIKCEINLMLRWSANCVITYSTCEGTFEITGTEIYIPVVPLSTQDHAKLLQPLKTGFTRIINWNMSTARPILYYIKQVFRFLN